MMLKCISIFLHSLASCLCFPNRFNSDTASAIIIWITLSAVCQNKTITWHNWHVSLQCTDLFHTLLTPSTKPRSSRGCWTWELIQWRAFQPSGTTKTSSGKSKVPWGPQNILKNKSRPTQKIQEYMYFCIYHLSTLPQSVHFWKTSSSYGHCVL